MVIVGWSRHERDRSRSDISPPQEGPELCLSGPRSRCKPDSLHPIELFWTAEENAVQEHYKGCFREIYHFCMSRTKPERGQNKGSRR